MDTRKQCLVETILFDSLSAFHDADDKDRITKLARGFFLDFCKKYEIDEQEAFEIIERMFKEKRETTMFKYEHYQDEKLSNILFGDDEKARNKTADKTLDER